MTARVTVCIPSYNHESTIERALTSATSQPEASEILVVDDCSTDATVAMAQAVGDPRIKVVRNERNLGLVGNHNRCLELASGDLIQFLHGDDALLPGAISQLASFFDDPEVGLVFAPRLLHTENETWRAEHGELGRGFRGLQDINDGNALLWQYVRRGRAKGNWLGEPTSVMLSASAARAAGGFDGRLVQMLDMEYWTRIIAGRRVGRNTTPTAIRTHDDRTATSANATVAVAYFDRLWLLRSLVANRAAGARVRGLALAWLAIALVRTGMDLARPDERGRQLRSHVRALRGARG